MRPIGEQTGVVSDRCPLCLARTEYGAIVLNPNRPSEWIAYCPQCGWDAINTKAKLEGRDLDDLDEWAFEVGNWRVQALIAELKTARKIIRAGRR